MTQNDELKKKLQIVADKLSYNYINNADGKTPDGYYVKDAVEELSTIYTEMVEGELKEFVEYNKRGIDAQLLKLDSSETVKESVARTFQHVKSGLDQSLKQYLLEKKGNL